MSVSSSPSDLLTRYPTFSDVPLALQADWIRARATLKAAQEAVRLRAMIAAQKSKSLQSLENKARETNSVVVQTFRRRSPGTKEWEPSRSHHFPRVVVKAHLRSKHRQPKTQKLGFVAMRQVEVGPVFPHRLPPRVNTA